MRIEATGLRATVQDRGRFGHLREGIPPSGPADPRAFLAAQALVGNHGVDAAAIEIVGDGFAFRCEDRRIVAVTGRDVALRGRDLVPGWTAAFARPGETYTVLCGERSRFTYLAVSGGIATEPILGSRSAYLPAGLGRPLRAGEDLPLGPARVDVERAGHLVVSPDYDTGQIRTITGPHAQRFTDDAHSLFFKSEFRVEPASDRMGTRLSGPRIPAREGEILTSGVVAGAVQIPSGGAPIVLLAEHQATGGYPVIATVILADLGLAAQRLPGEPVRFARVERAVAVEALRDADAALAEIA
ncbi:MAG TPA: biotin-dependent carboxyltransferase family protein [Thermoanaerobaculia bacterium]|nr:biotin-dependent carboxyltransferase family protein [Thermoanaerobaculia bacterium]